MLLRKQNSCELLMLTTPCQNRRKKCRSVHYWLISVRILWLSAGSFWGLLMYELVSFSIIILCCFNLMLKDMTNSTAELNGASHHVVWVKVGVSCSKSCIQISKFVPVPVCISVSSLLHRLSLELYMFFYSYLVFELPVSCSVKPLNFYMLSLD